MVKYTYNAWGKSLEISDYSENNLGTINPLRYRGYYYDQETGLYYLQSRYYDPTVGRFINADDVSFLGVNGTVLSHNLFAYCGNNPVTRSDSKGEFFLSLAIGFGVGSLISGVAKIYKNYKSGRKWYKGLAISMLAGGVGGAISCITIPGVSSWVCASVFGGTGNVATQLILGEIKTIGDLTSAISVGVSAGLIGDASAKLLIKGVTKHFNSLTKSAQKRFLKSVGKITNRQLTAIRQQAKKGLTPAILDKLVKKYGYDIVVSSWVSSSLSTAK